MILVSTSLALILKRFLFKQVWLSRFVHVRRGNDNSQSRAALHMHCFASDLIPVPYSSTATRSAFLFG